MMLSRVVSLLSVLLLAVASTPRMADAQCATARVRRSWTSLSDAERQLYRDAIGAAMDSGAYIKFVEIHTEMMSEMEAHRQCMFIYWHRLFLTAFENMLRGQGTRFACVTVPYWDWITDYSAFSTGACSNLLACSPALGFLGGRAPVSRGWRSVTINGAAVGGYCEADAPMNRFCQSSLVSGTRCARCLPRADWSQRAFPASASFASVRAQLFGATNIGQMSTAIEQGVHNSIHAELGSTMATFASPADPVFWSHHATVDLLHSIFHKCKVGEQRLTLAQKAASVSWSSCERRNGGVFNPTDTITMRTGYMGRSPVRATQDVRVGRFFSAVPQQFAALVDIRDLGASSYSYQLQGLLGSLFTECGVVVGNTTAPRQLQMEQNAGKSRSYSSGSSSASGDASVVLPDTTVPSAAVAQTPPPAMASMINTTVAPDAKKVQAWVNATDKLVKRRGGNAVKEAEKMTCLFQDECLGGVTSYTPEFKKRFGITGEPRCKQIVDRLNRKADSVKVTEWKAQMVQTFGCPKPKPKQSSGSATGNPAAQTAATPSPSSAPVTTAPVPTTPCPNAAKASGATNVNANTIMRVSPMAQRPVAAVAAASASVSAQAAPLTPVTVSPAAAVSPCATVSAGNANGGSYVNIAAQRATK